MTQAGQSKGSIGHALTEVQHMFLNFFALFVGFFDKNEQELEGAWLNKWSIN